MSARDIAYQVLLQLERADAYLNVALDSALRTAGVLPRQESALATELAYGVERRRLALDAAIAAHLDRPITKLETGVLVALRLGAYQLLYLSRVPAHAAVGETVNLVKKNKLTRAAGFVNAVLRKLAADPKVPLPDEPLLRVSIEESHPLWLVRRWAERFGLDEARALCAADNAAPKVTVRVNDTRTTREELLAALTAEGVTATAAPLSPLGVVLEESGPVFALESFRKGLFQVQDEAAQLVTQLAGAKPGMRILDACAAPGGKTCYLAASLRGEGEVVAVDQYERKLERLMTEAKRLGVDGQIRTHAADASKPLPYEEKSFDVVLLDAPCSGLGTLRRHPELRYRRKESDIARLAADQSALLQNVVRYLKPSGAFVYAVCTTEPEEGSAHVAELEEHGLKVVGPPLTNDVFEKVRTPEGGIATYPHRHGTDGFYAVRLARL